MTGGPLVAGGAGTVVDVVAAVVPGPAVHAHALVAAVRVVARAAVLARVGHELALVDIVHAVLTCGGATIIVPSTPLVTKHYFAFEK